MKFKTYIKPLISLLEEHKNAQNAANVEKYMRNKFAFYGIKTDERRKLCRQFTNEYGFPPIEEIPNFVYELWTHEYRDIHYFTMDTVNKFSEKSDENWIEVFEYMITNNSWWDTVDIIASRIIGTHFKTYPNAINTTTTTWIESENFWLNRTAILFQLHYKTLTDSELLFNYILKVSESKEFFIRKAIGWALRQYSKTAPETVRNFVDTTQLSPLSKREALKWINRNK